MTARANWRGTLRIGELDCPVALYTAVSTAERVAFHIINRATGHRVRRHYVDEATGEPVERDDQVKGYETEPGEYVILDADDIAEAVPDSDKILSVTAFVRSDEIDDLYMDRSYYLAAGTADGRARHALVRDAMRARHVAALARTVLFRRVRTLLIRPEGDGLIATVLNTRDEIHPAQEAFADLPDLALNDDMIALAQQIIRSKSGHFDPTQFTDRYEAALGDLIRAKLAGRVPRAPPRRPAGQVIDLMAALRASAQSAPPARPASGHARRGKPPRRKAG
ncbi:Ku protein [Nguyenibacter sp. L1]|uniref:non-homologous end joining protein Ku n=1 Tax=Nguyenibacter sp. L1 TaxID=3049350 RepID=UPI002B498824|nr:Ku protein [Nguyenibacter sp. L1]WRH88909.1 Ku protein [Nguyenibacter sp. L1]